LSPTRSLGPPWIQIDIQDTYKFRFGLSTYALKYDAIKFPMAPVPGPTKIGFGQNCRNNFNIWSPTHSGAIHIKTNAQVTYDIQLGHSWTPWKVKEIASPIELVPCPNSSGINRKHLKNWTSRICLAVAPSFLAFGPCIVSSPLGLHPGGTCTSLYPL
jgi:hypothetical protein